MIRSSSSALGIHPANILLVRDILAFLKQEVKSEENAVPCPESRHGRPGLRFLRNLGELHAGRHSRIDRPLSYHSTLIGRLDGSRTSHISFLPSGFVLSGSIQFRRGWSSFGKPPNATLSFVSRERSEHGSMPS